MAHSEIWDDSALVDSWNEALEEYKHYHSLRAHGETIEDVLRVEEEDEESKNTERISRNNRTSEGEDGMITDPSREPKVRNEDNHASAQRVDEVGVAGNANDKVFLGEGDEQDTKRNDASSAAQPPLPHHLIGAVADENLKNLLMSWYYAGYYTGLYEGQQKIRPADQGK